MNRSFYRDPGTSIKTKGPIATTNIVQCHSFAFCQGSRNGNVVSCPGFRVIAMSRGESGVPSYLQQPPPGPVTSLYAVRKNALSVDRVEVSAQTVGKRGTGFAAVPD